MRNCVSYSIRDIYCRGTTGYGSLENIDKKIQIRATGILCRKFHVIYDRLCMGNPFFNTFQNLFSGHFKFVPEMDITCSNKGMDPWPESVFNCFTSDIYVMTRTPCQSCYDRVFDRSRDLPHCFEVPL